MGLNSPSDPSKFVLIGAARETHTVGDTKSTSRANLYPEEKRALRAGGIDFHLSS